MKNMSLQEWISKGEALFGKNIEDWKFVCPACGHIASVKEFTELGVDADYAKGNCIGRLTGKGSPVEGDNSGCNWTAGGLFGTLGKGVKVSRPDGKVVEAFMFYES